MNEADSYEEVVEDVIDEHLTPTANEPGVSRHSSGVCETVCSIGAHRKAPRAETLKEDIKCDVCSKPYKTLKGYQKHVFMHKVKGMVLRLLHNHVYLRTALLLFPISIILSDYNQRKPDQELVIIAAEDILTSILKELLEDFKGCQEETDIVNELLSSISTTGWIIFFQTFSEPVTEALSARTKLLPSNQFEEFLINYNKFLNNRQQFSSLKDSFVNLVSEKFKSSCSVTLILNRLCVRFPEEVQLFITKEMIKGNTTHSQPVIEFNEKAFSSDISSILRHYFIKGCMLLTNEVWKLRCLCIQMNFVSFRDEDCDLKLKSNWTSGSVYPSSGFVNFCKGVEFVIQSRLEVQDINLDNLVIDLLDPAHSNICNCWTSLTTEYFSEVDSIVFMRDFVSILLKRSLKLEEAGIRGHHEGRQKFQRVGIRENLHRN